MCGRGLVCGGSRGLAERMGERWALLAFGTLVSHAVQRVLLAMLAAFVVAGAEAALYVIWTSYTAPSGRNRAQRLLDKKNEPLSEITNSDAGASASGEASTTATENNIDLRQRGPVQADL
jgi:hypothetical protein